MVWVKQNFYQERNLFHKKIVVQKVWVKQNYCQKKELSSQNDMVKKIKAPKHMGLKSLVQIWLVNA